MANSRLGLRTRPGEVVAYTQTEQGPIPQPLISLTGLQQYFIFDGNLNDSSGNGRNLTLTQGSVTYSSAIRKIGAQTAVWSSGTEAERTGTLGFRFSNNTASNFTFTGWIYSTQDIPNDLDRYLLFISAGDQASGGNLEVGVGIWNNGGTKSLYIEMFYGSQNRQFTPYTLTLNTWHFVAITFTGGTTYTTRVYINDVLINTPHNGTITQGSPGFTTRERLYSSVGASRSFVGNVDETTIWNRVLTNTELTTLYNATTPLIP
jgi:hypothetical protein